MSTWKSSILSKLEVFSASSIDTGIKGAAKGLALAATVAAGLGMTPTNALADAPTYTPPPKAEATGLRKIFKDIIYADELVKAPIRDAILDPLVDPEIQKMALESEESTFQHAVGVAGTAMAVTSAAPAMGAWIVLRQADRTYDFIQDKQQEQVDIKMREVTDRTRAVYFAEIEKMRVADADKRVDFVIDPVIMEQLEQTITKTAYADVPTSNANIDALLSQDKEKTKERDNTPSYAP